MLWIARGGRARQYAASFVALGVSALTGARIASGSASGATCGGDSGSPVFVRGGELEVQVGVHAWGNTGCQGEANASRVQSGSDWIFAQLVR